MGPFIFPERAVAYGRKRSEDCPSVGLHLGYKIEAAVSSQHEVAKSELTYS
jgi:hypothetical protein